MNTGLPSAEPHRDQGCGLLLLLHTCYLVHSICLWRISSSWFSRRKEGCSLGWVCLGGSSLPG